MQAIDITKIVKSTIGSLVTEEQPVWMLADNCFYILPSHEGIDEKILYEFRTNLFDINSNSYLNNYNYEVLEYVPDFNKYKNLKKAIADENANFILPLYTPHLSQKQYLVFQSIDENLFSNLGLAIYTAEQISVKSLREALGLFAKNNVDVFCEIAKTTINTRAFLKDFITDAVSNIFNPTLCGFVPTQNFLPDISEAFTFRKKKKLLERMEDNLRKYKKNKDPQAEAELSAIFKNLDTDILIAIFSKLPQKQRAKLYD